MKSLKNAVSSLICLISVGCATSAKYLRIETKPIQADVYQYKERNKTFVKIGETPLEINGKELNNLKDFTAFKIEKNGYVVEHLVFDKSSTGNLDYLVPLKPVESWSDVDAEVSSKLADAIARKVQSINRLVMNKKLNEALSLTEELVEQYPKAHTFHDIKGSIYILKGQKQAAMASLKKSLSLNPGNMETGKLLKTLQEERR